MTRTEKGVIPRRNDPCPCGSGKKYKHCCGALKQSGSPRPNSTSQSSVYSSTSSSQAIDSGFSLYGRGDIAGAMAIANEAIKSKPDMPEAYALKGMCNYATRELGEARQDFLRADNFASKLRNPNDISSIKLSLSTIELDLGNGVEAERYARDAIKLGLNTSASVNQLGASLAAQKKFEESIEEFDKAIQLNRGDPQLWVNKGSSHYFLRDKQNAIKCFQEALNLNPDFVPALKNLASYYYKERNYTLASELLEKANKLVPGDIQALTSLAIAYSDSNRTSDARRIIGEAARIDPDNPDVVSTLLDVLIKDNDLFSACPLAGRILEKPELESLLLKTLVPLEKACAFKEREEVLARVRDTQYFDDKKMENLVSVLLSLNYTNTLSINDIKKFHDMVGEYLISKIDASVFKNDPVTYQKNSKIKIGYVSSDFCDHSVGYFIKNIIKGHDASKFEIFCYGDLDNDDAVTKEIRNHAFEFRNITNINDENVASLIKRDSIQILVDLGGYTGKYRLPAFAYKPAPVQITYLGYPNTTGLKTMDYRITDTFAEDPDGTPYSEKLLFMPESFLCFGDFPSQNIDPIPAFKKNGFITFGNFNNVGKLTEEGIGVWSEILHRVPGSVIMFKNGWLGQEITRSNILSEFRNNRIEQDRIKFQSFINKKVSHLDFYNNIDISLDTFPYNGTTTTCEALWMGVPVVTLLGKKHSQRVSYSILKNTGLEGLVANNQSEYIDIASRLALDPDSLGKLMKKIPEKLSESILCKPDIFINQLESIYRDVWDKYLAKQ